MMRTGSATIEQVAGVIGEPHLNGAQSVASSVFGLGRQYLVLTQYRDLQPKFVGLFLCHHVHFAVKGVAKGIVDFGWDTIKEQVAELAKSAVGIANAYAVLASNFT